MKKEEGEGSHSGSPGHCRSFIVDRIRPSLVATSPKATWRFGSQMNKGEGEGVRLAHLSIVRRRLHLFLTSSFVCWAGEVARHLSSSCPLGWWSGMAMLSHPLSLSWSARWAGKVTCCLTSLCLLDWLRGVVVRLLAQ
jgi:hypothetical protein